MIVITAPTGHIGHYLGFSRAASEAITSRGVKRVVGVSTLGHGITEHAGHLSAALAADGLIQSTGVNYRALQMPFFMENLLHQVGAIKSQGTFFLANSADRTLLTVATRDIAATAATLLLDDTWSGQHGVPVVGPDDLSPAGMARSCRTSSSGRSASTTSFRQWCEEELRPAVLA